MHVAAAAAQSPVDRSLPRSFYYLPFVVVFYMCRYRDFEVAFTIHVMSEMETQLT